MPPSLKHTFLIKRRFNSTFSHKFVEQAALLIKINEVQYLCLLLQVLQEMLS